MSYDEYLSFSRRWLRKAYNLAKDDGRMCLSILLDLTNDGRQSIGADITSIAKEVGWRYNATIIWNKNNLSKCTAFGSWMSARAPFVSAPVELILVFYKNRWEKDSGSQVSDFTSEEYLEWSKAIWNMPGENSNYHPCPFPVEIPRRCIKLFSYIGDTILDPFMGTSTTLQACIELGRRGIGVDIDEFYCDMGRSQLSNVSNSAISTYMKFEEESVVSALPT